MVRESCLKPNVTLKSVEQRFKTWYFCRIMTIISVVLGRTFHYVDEVLPFRFEYSGKNY